MKLADVELNELEEAVIPDNIINWVRNRVVEKIADKIVEETWEDVAEGFWGRGLDGKQLHQAVLDKLADRIINVWLEQEGGLK